MHQIIQLDPNYKDLIQQLKQKVVSARTRAILAINSEQIHLYWEIGRVIIKRQKHSNWGTKLIEQISADLNATFPDMKGWSTRNLRKMKQLAKLYPGNEFLTQPVSQLPWGHIIILFQKVKESSVREWYANEALKQGWARSTLTHHINMDLFARQGQHEHKLTNFKAQLPDQQSDLAHEFIQDPLDLGFLPITKGAKEREIENALINHVKEFLLRMGTGFAFVGNQYRLEVGGDEFYLDLLLFHIKLNAYVVVEIKKDSFKPEHAGKLNFYLSAMDEIVKETHHAPTLGLLLCESRNRVVAEYALSRTESPMGIAQYQLSKQIPSEMQVALPSIELLEDQLSDRLNAGKS